MSATPIAKDDFKRGLFSGNPPHAPYRYGWVVKLLQRGRGGLMIKRRATPAEKVWLEAHGYLFASGNWVRADRGSPRPCRHPEHRRGTHGGLRRNVEVCMNCGEQVPRG